MSRSSAAAAVVLVLLTAACRIERTERPPLADPGSAARVAIETALFQFQTALSDGDAPRATSFFTADGTLLLDGSGEHSGRGEIATGIEQSPLDGQHIALTSEAIDIVSSVAWQIGTFSQQTADSVAGATGRFVIRWERGPDATWRMQRVLLARFPVDTTTAPSP